MMTEELKIKITVDDSDVKNISRKVKQSFQSINTGMSGTGKASKEVNDSIEELKDSMEAIRNLDVWDMVIDHLDGIKKGLNGASEQAKSFGAHMKEAMASIKVGFDKKHWKDLGYDTSFKEQMKNIKWGFNDAKDSMVAGLAHIRAGFNELSDVVNDVFPPMLRKLAAIAASIVAVVASIKNAINTAARIKEMNAEAQKIGLSISAYQEWGYVLNSVGVGVDKLSDFIKTLSEEQLAVREGSEDMINSFKRLGLSAEKVINMSQEELFTETVKRLQNVKNETDRVSIAYQIFGEDAAELSNVLRLTNAETASLANNTYMLGAAMSDGLIEKSSALSKAVSNLKLAWQGLTQTLAELVMPVVTVIVNALTKAIVIVNLFIKTLFGLDLTGSTKAAISGATGGVSSYTDSVNEATGAVEKLKRVTMGFDELNIVQNPNSSSGAGASGDSGGAGFTMPEMGEGLSSLKDSLDLSGIHEFFSKWKGLIQDLVPTAMIGIGVIGCVLCLMTGNISGAAAFAAMAGIGFWAAESNGMWERYRAKLHEINLGFVPACMVGIGAIGAVISLLMGNIPAAIGFAAMAGIGLKLGGGSDIKRFVGQFENEIKGVAVVATVAVAAAGAVICALTGNWVGAIALAGLAGIGIAGMASGKGFGDFVKNIKQYIPEIISASTAILAAAGAAILALSGNLPGAIAMAGVAGIAIYNAATGGNFFADLVRGIKKIWDDLSSWFKSEVAPIFTKDWWKKKFDTVKEGASIKLEEASKTIKTKWNSLKAWWAGGPGTIFTKQFWLNVFETVRSAIQTKLGETKTAIETGWNTISSYWTTNIAPKFTKHYWIDKFESFRVAMNEKLIAAHTVISTMWGKIASWFNTTVAPKFTKQYWMDKFEPMRSAISEKLTAVKVVMEDVWTKIRGWFVNNIAPKFTTTFWANKFGTIKDGAKAAFNGVIAVVEKAINGIIKKLNTISWKIPDWVPQFGGDRFGFSLKTVSIPRLATGGIATQSTLVNIGEAGREAVLPLDNNTGWMDKLADRIASRSKGPSKIVLKVGERELGWASINGINQITRQTGELQLVL